MTNPSNVGQQPNLEPQPNSNAAVQDLQIQVAYGDAAGILPNMPLVNVNNIIQLCQQMQLEIQQMQLEIQQSRNELRTEQRLLPIRLYNCSDREYAPIRYPEGLAPHPALPACRYDIANLTIPQCQTVAAHLGLPVLRGNPLVDDRRRQIAEYLGVPLS
ncbi:hypothetical protein DFP73DRAFT_547312 [Morchella snyderi]|nr:hypothetical protein DFP73DRAFT_547312 [Morchella snyderi]